MTAVRTFSSVKMYFCLALSLSNGPEGQEIMPVVGRVRGSLYPLHEPGIFET
jgi:hypothetical protein